MNYIQSLSKTIVDSFQDFPIDQATAHSIKTEGICGPGTVEVRDAVVSTALNQLAMQFSENCELEISRLKDTIEKRREEILLQVTRQILEKGLSGSCEWVDIESGHMRA